MEVYKNRLIAENVDDDKTSNVSIALTTAYKISWWKQSKYLYNFMEFYLSKDKISNSLDIYILWIYKKCSKYCWTMAEYIILMLFTQ